MVNCDMRRERLSVKLVGWPGVVEVSEVGLADRIFGMLVLALEAYLLQMWRLCGDQQQSKRAVFKHNDVRVLPKTN